MTPNIKTIPLNEPLADVGAWEQIKQAEIGQSFSDRQIDACCRAVYGGVAWTGAHPGFAVLVAQRLGKEGRADDYEYCVLDECEHGDMRELIRACMEMDKRWEPQRWFGDASNGSAEESILELNEGADRRFELTPSCVLDTDGRGNKMDPMYPYLLGTIKELLKERRKRLFLKGSKVVNYLAMIEPQQVNELQLGSFPAVEALSWPLIEMLRDVRLPTFTQTHTGDDGPVHVKTLRDLATTGAYDDLGADGEEDEDDQMYTV